MYGYWNTKKSDLADDDGVDLINKAFSEKNPLIKINKLSTTTEKINKQVLEIYQKD